MITDKGGNNANGVVDIRWDVAANEILQENHYYAFGMAYEGKWLMNDAGVRDNQYMYNGKEINADFGLNWNDYGARWYDPSVGRWNAVDPMAANHFGESPFIYAGNSPLIFIDPDGMDYYRNEESGEVVWLNSEEKEMKGYKYLGAKNTEQSVMSAVGAHIMGKGGWKAFLKYYMSNRFGEDFFFAAADLNADNASGFMGTVLDNYPIARSGTRLSVLTHRWVDSQGWTEQRNQLEHNIGMFLMTSKYGRLDSKFVGYSNELRGLFINDIQGGNFWRALRGREAQNGGHTAFEWADIWNNEEGISLFQKWAERTACPCQYSTSIREQSKSKERWQQIRRRIK